MNDWGMNRPTISSAYAGSVIVKRMVTRSHEKRAGLTQLDT
jgi:hypothetical protein